MDKNAIVAEMRRALGQKPLTKSFAKFEVFFGLAGVWIGLFLVVSGSARAGDSSAMWFAASFGLFVLGGYLAMAGSRSHLYQSGNELTAYLVHVIGQEGRAEPIRPSQERASAV